MTGATYDVEHRTVRWTTSAPAAADVVAVHLRRAGVPVEWFLYARGTATEIVVPEMPGVPASGADVTMKALWLMRSGELAAHPFARLLPGAPAEFAEPRASDLAVSRLAL
ncbi:MAG: hypothetical protein KIT31_20755 [Deltaproteobacteria bacterium]|nr:hypothetical protein [Deltaproteobacteria bacterium]